MAGNQNDCNRHDFEPPKDEASKAGRVGGVRRRVGVGSRKRGGGGKRRRGEGEGAAGKEVLRWTNSVLLVPLRKLHTTAVSGVRAYSCFYLYDKAFVWPLKTPFLYSFPCVIAPR